MIELSFVFWTQKKMVVGALATVLALGGMLIGTTAWATTADECLECHGEEGLERESGDDATGLLVPPEPFKASVHGGFDCTDCHQDAKLVDYEHQVSLQDVDCARCHDGAMDEYKESQHGQALKKGDPLAPKCWSCHTKHAVFAPDDERSSVYKFNVPATCSQCHQEGASVPTKRHPAEHDVVKNYSMSIHGVGVFKRGLTVAAVCTDCHGDHDILAHDNPKSTINQNNVANTCQQCHGEIKKVHRKIVKGEVWEKPNHEVPSCIDCHSPHKIRRVAYSGVFADADCLVCHEKSGDEAPVRKADGKKLTVDEEHLQESVHETLNCVKCHTGVNTVDDPPCLHTGKVDCASCHQDQGAQYEHGIHGRLHKEGNKQVPTCKQCHGAHQVKAHTDETSPTYKTRIHLLCTNCHQENGAGGTGHNGDHRDISGSYLQSVHGKGLMEAGLLVTATCTNCHTAHRPLSADDEDSTVNPKNQPATCGACHAGVFEKFKSSIHSPLVSNTKERLPVCADCHDSHAIARINEAGFRKKILGECGACHKEVAASYFETYHGKVSLLGSSKAAKCSDCHGSHNILPPHMAKSTLSRDNIVATCGKCHEKSHTQFTGYLTHATHKDKARFPSVYYSYWAMTFLLLGTIIFFTIHTLLWLPRSIREAVKKRKEHQLIDADEEWVQRFRPWHRVTHVVVILSFFTLAITGMVLKFSYTGWAQGVANALGGFAAAGTLHRTAAVATFGYFLFHLTFLFMEKKRQGKGWISFVFQKEGMFPNLNDLREFVASIKWFVGKGPRPDYGRWTYWEKFDYFAVFWGVAMIGASGLILWFPELFTLVFPGKAINVATIIHSDEALLAAGFIFTIHFFNTHFRPDKFPMDHVIFTGRMPLKEFKEERPREYRELKESGKLVNYMVEGPSKQFVRGVYIFGLSALMLGFSLVVAIAYSLIFL